MNMLDRTEWDFRDVTDAAAVCGWEFAREAPMGETWEPWGKLNEKTKVSRVKRSYQFCQRGDTTRTQSNEFRPKRQYLTRRFPRA